MSSYYPIFLHVRDKDLPALKSLERYLQHYVDKQPEHDAGICYWLSGFHGNGDISNEEFSAMLGLVRSLMNISGHTGAYVDWDTGPTQKRVTWALHARENCAAAIYFNEHRQELLNDYHY
jgi:hypothetical protein